MRIDSADAAPPLSWGCEGENLTASTPDGTYCIEPNAKGPGYAVLWTPAGGKSKRIASDLPATGEAKEAVRLHQLERQGDAILANAGDGAMNAKELKGEAGIRKAVQRFKDAIPPGTEVTFSAGGRSTTVKKGARR